MSLCTAVSYEQPQCGVWRTAMGKVRVNSIKPRSQGLDHTLGLTPDLSQRRHFLEFESKIIRR